MSSGEGAYLMLNGYTIDPEWCGREERAYVVRQYGDWIGAYETPGRAEYEIEIVRGGNLPRRNPTDRKLK